MANRPPLRHPYGLPPDLSYPSSASGKRKRDDDGEESLDAHSDNNNNNNPHPKKRRSSSTNPPPSLFRSLITTKRKREVDDEQNLDKSNVESPPKRRTMNRSSSTSSDIRVGRHSPNLDKWTPGWTPGVRARHIGLNQVIVSGLPRDFLRRLADEDRPLPRPAQGLAKVDPPAAETDTLDDSQRNARGTFSKEYMLNFPHIHWVHRGQGRYLPASECKEKTPVPAPAQAPGRKSLILNLSTKRPEGRSESTEPEGSSAADPRASRLARRVKIPGPAAKDGSILVAGNRTGLVQRDAEDSLAEDVNKTYKRDEMERMKAQGDTAPWYHTGNGWFKRGERATLARDSSSQPQPQRAESVAPGLRKSSRTNLKAESSLEDQLPGHAMRMDELTAKYPSHPYHHCGNGWYKLGPAPPKKRPEQPAPTPDPQTAGLAAADDGPDTKGTVSKAYKDSHPEYAWVHRGNGRYKRAETTQGDQAGGLPDPQPTADHKPPPPAPPAPRLPTSRKQPGPTSRDDIDRDDGAESGSLVDKAYVDSHPDQDFHHRGQGKWAKGLPPAGTSRKVAVRGPGAAEYHERNKQRSPAPAAGLEQAELPNGPEPPAVTALVAKEIKDKWPQLSWYYRGGGKWSRTSKDGVGSQSQVMRETGVAAGGNGGNPAYGDAPFPSQPSVGRGKAKPTLRKAPSSSGTTTPRPRMLEPEEDVLTDTDLPELHLDKWPTPDPNEPDDAAAQVVRTHYLPMRSPTALIDSLTKYESAARPLENLIRLAEHAHGWLDAMQREYVELDRITAPHARTARKAARGGRQPVNAAEFDDRKEAALYDYAFDSKRIGMQDPIAQKIHRDSEGRELRAMSRRRGEVDLVASAASAGDAGVARATRRQVRPVQRFDAIEAQAAPRRKRTVNKAGSARTTASPGAGTPAPLVAGDLAPADGAAAGNERLPTHVPKRVRELRAESVPSVGSSNDSASNTGSEAARRGRPQGSRNLRKRKDAGVPKGPRKRQALEEDHPSNADADMEMSGANGAQDLP